MVDEIRETRMASGLTIVSDRMADVRSATLGFFFRVGARHEPVGLHGISHFIEHTVFKGSGKRTALEIAIEQDRLGGNLDAFTTHEETGFAIKVIDDQLPRAFDLIADMLLNPRFDERDLISEQKVIIEEMKMVEDSPEEQLGDLFNEAFFGDHPLGRNITGTAETVRSFDRAATGAYHDEVFNASNLVIAAAGNLEHEQLLALVENAGFGRSEQRRDSLKPAIITPDPLAPILTRQNDNLEQAHLIIATPYPGATDKRRYAADMLANAIGGGTSSRLWQKIREESGLAYSVGASSVMYQDCGLFTLFAATSPEQVREVIDLSIAEMRDVVANGVTPDELDLAKQQARASILLSLEDSASRAAALAQNEMIHGRQISVEETLAEVDAVTLEDCADIANEFFMTEKIAFAALGDLPDLEIDRGNLRLQ